MTDTEKAKYIIEDYLKRVVIPCGNIPTEVVKADHWFTDVFMKYQSEFIARYEGKSMNSFVKKLVLLYGDVVEEEFRYLFTPGYEKKK